ncbi:MAG: HupE/UreJ family protein [Rhizobiaceae bacterium]
MTRRIAVPTLLAALSTVDVAMAHSGSAAGSGFWSGLAHPVFGWDHVAAMVAVGLWGAFLGRPAVWVLPIAFPAVMAAGAAAGIAAIPVPAVETGIALSAVVLGLAVLFAVRAPLWLAAVLVGTFAVFHGHAHGTELPDAANPFAYAAGFVAGTGLLHLAGIGFAAFARGGTGAIAVRACGALISLVGSAFLLGLA